ncbi:M17 family metallopeptidase [Mesoplasma lactucae]|uniref:Probable cytosol aminopeptidase n=1 Tax=Mesoplasma lactucae ATCC 49193 TaxID=81460 RepID=A0A291ISV6_9MOLU|nr:M17 family metallopeptidase [Mesoplasma lactucae]ATG97786.1 peptidase M17 [Mesoplasma lactucae ATCC 49193]ATZ20436.1 leucyl aminopeptidase [Mesoplasma lactucae ATCC 49193]MCL8216608.1 cytosol aminopeptidase [Mesoplasma lactucae ATCC 49193]
MITLNNKDKNEYKVQYINNDLANNNPLIKATKTSYFLDDKDKVIYIKVKENKDRRLELKRAISEFVKANIMNVDIDLDSFINGYCDAYYTSELLFNDIVETIGYNTYQELTDKKENKPSVEYNYNLLTSLNGFDDEFKKEMIKIEFQNYARTLQDTPPNIATSVWLAHRIKEDAKKIPNVKVTVLGKKEAEKLGMGLFLAVNAGSEIEPQVVIVEYNNAPETDKTVLVGKGITFDSGGYNLKPARYLEGMKFDMSGAAIMISTVFALAKAEVKTNVAAIGMFTDNRIGGHAILAESVVKSMNGLTVQIDNTDAEGRMVLADGMTYAIRELHADKIIEASTLTGAIVVALGPWMSAAFTTSDEMWEPLKQAQSYSDEKIWRMPIMQEHLEKMQKTPIADLTNAEPGSDAGASTAAAFLNEFAEGKPYIHLDIAGTADNTKRGTGVMVKTLFELLSK